MWSSSWLCPDPFQRFEDILNFGCRERRTVRLTPEPEAAILKALKQAVKEPGKADGMLTVEFSSTACGSGLYVQAPPMAMAAYLRKDLLVRDMLKAGCSRACGEDMHFFRGRKVSEGIEVEKELTLPCLEYYLLYSTLPASVRGLFLNDVIHERKDRVIFRHAFTDMRSLIGHDLQWDLQTDDDRNRLYCGALTGMQKAFQFLLGCRERMGSCQVRVSVDFINEDNDQVWLDMPENFRVMPLWTGLLFRYLEMVRLDLYRLQDGKLSRELKGDERDREVLYRGLIRKFTGNELQYSGEMIDTLAEYCSPSEVNRGFLLNLLMDQLIVRRRFDALIPDPEDATVKLEETYVPSVRRLLERWDISEELFIHNAWTGSRTFHINPGPTEYPVHQVFSREIAEILVEILGHPLRLNAECYVEMGLLKALIRDMDSVRNSAEALDSLIDTVRGENRVTDMWYDIVNNGAPEFLVRAVKKNLIPRTRLRKMALYAIKTGKTDLVPYLMGMM